MQANLCERTSLRSCSACATYFPFGLKRNAFPTFSFGAPSKPLSGPLAAAAAYGFAVAATDEMIGGVLEADGMEGTGEDDESRAFACVDSVKLKVKDKILITITLIDANFGCMGRYRSRLDWGMTGVLSNNNG